MALMLQRLSTEKILSMRNGLWSYRFHDRTLIIATICLRFWVKYQYQIIKSVLDYAHEVKRQIELLESSKGVEMKAG